jgi:hypothetical protein
MSAMDTPPSRFGQPTLAETVSQWERAMTPAELAAIRARIAGVAEPSGVVRDPDKIVAALRDRRWLLAEVERLTAECDEWRHKAIRRNLALARAERERDDAVWWRDRLDQAICAARYRLTGGRASLEPMNRTERAVLETLSHIGEDDAEDAPEPPADAGTGAR